MPCAAPVTTTTLSRTIIFLSFNIDYGPAADLARQNLLAQFENFTERLDRDHCVEMIHRQVAHDAGPDLATASVRHPGGIDAGQVDAAQNKGKHRGRDV